MPTFAMQAAVQIRKLQKVYIGRDVSKRLGLKLMPFNTQDVTELIYEREDVNRGIQNARGSGNPAGAVVRPDISEKRFTPGHYGDTYVIDESELENRREVGTWTEFEKQGALSDKIARLFTDRYLDRVEKNIFDILCTGKFEARTPSRGGTGPVVVRSIHNIPQYTPANLFSNLTTSTPIQYFRSLMPQLQLGVSVDFRQGWAIANRNTINTILNNQNSTDISSRRTNSGDTVNDLSSLNAILASNDIFNLTEYHKGYFPEGNGNPMVTFIPDGKIILVGTREDGEPIGDYVLTRNAHNANSAPGEHFMVNDYRTKTPPHIEMTAGHNGGPVPLYLEAMAIINAY